ncbi:hypothetical protein G6F57_004427 [Rhizopus arrhizus]|uniref:Uncharacterized protein n=1 Tax=Rhizopus oryzae TaxID=64495 RepID=A0A9P6XFA8_RHIOR|nr:hypothetical protein G6F23_011384 [Rhizopus arrhizus]KAG1395323.1 hypothetical protein G6F58_011953 [Rhizopus delemar]KAG0764230.1 hypothetical protein G6F24_005379 [Rhizopus arrhizus]KAG0778561.1 hypothetical protein G6F22_011163 [Rhizopus arrhizus]KAG0790817.1 hypothetical protein G6F21_005530 [Rhizopus arrhizus]
MMCDTNWCTFCDNAISPYSDSLYCSEECLRQDALLHHPMLGYDYADLRGFPHVGTTDICSKRKSSTQSLTSSSTYFNQLHKPSTPSFSSPSLSSSLSSDSSHEDHQPFTTHYYQPKPRRASPIHFMEQLNQAMLHS